MSRGFRRAVSKYLNIAALCLVMPAFATASGAQDLEVTLLGTGDPQPSVDRFGPSTLVRAGGLVVLVDAGRGAIQRLTQLGVSYADVDAVLLTHFHSDHLAGLPDLWLTGWLISGRDRPLKVFGPAGTRELVEGLRQAFAFDVGIRVQDDRAPAAGAQIEVVEIKEGVVLEDEGVRVQAFDVDHRPIVPALGYRIDFRGRSVVISGDTRFSPNLIEKARGVDLLVHEVGDAPPEVLARDEDVRRVVAHHTRAADVGRVFATVKPKLAVFSHLTLLGGFSVANLVDSARSTYAGPLVVGQDLMRFIVSDQITVIALR